MSLMSVLNSKAFWDVSKLMLSINAAGFTITALTKTHKITDLVGAGTFGIAACYALYKSRNSEKSKQLLTLCICLWSLRLSSFLFVRVLKAGEDRRLRSFFPNPHKPDQGWLTDGVKSKLFKLAFFWSLQTIWGILVLSPITVANLYGQSLNNKIPKITWIGFASFLFFFVYETTADLQKFWFKENAANAGRICTIGLYKYSRFPNYFGEIGVWFSLFWMAIPLLKRNHYWTVISPLFTLFLLNNVSGVPLLMASWKKRYGHLPEYKEWIANTNKYIPALFASTKDEL